MGWSREALLPQIRYSIFPGQGRRFGRRGGDIRDPRDAGRKDLQRFLSTDVAAPPPPALPPALATHERAKRLVHLVAPTPVCTGQRTRQHIFRPPPPCCYVAHEGLQHYQFVS